MAEIDPSPVPRLPLEFMNADHALEATLLADVERALDAHRRGEGSLERVLEKLSVFAVHTRDHFLREESHMRETRFPAYAAHKAEHDRVLAEMNAQASAFREGGDGERLSRYLFDALPRWFADHLRSMDAMTARTVAAAPAR